MNHCSDVILHHLAMFKISTNPIAVSRWLVTIPAIVHLKLTRISGEVINPSQKCMLSL